jgi:hypothetical protein
MSYQISQALNGLFTQEQVDALKGVIDQNTLPNSVLNRQQSNAFIDMLVDETVLIKNIRRSVVSAPKGEINKLDIGVIVTEGAHATSGATVRGVTEDAVSYDTVKYRSAFDIRQDFLEDNLEGPAVRDKILRMFTKRIAIDSELAAIRSDDTLTVGDSQSDENNLYGVNVGFNKILLDEVPAGQILAAEGAAPSHKLYYDMKRLIPSRYRAAAPNYTWVMPSGPHDKWQYDMSLRETNYGDSAIMGVPVKGPMGYPMLQVPLMPEDMTYTGGSGGSTGSMIWLTPLDNLIFFIQREITIEFERKPRLDLWEATIHWRGDFEVENPDLCVIAHEVDMSGSDYAG